MRKFRWNGGEIDVRCLTDKEIRSGSDFGMCYLLPGLTQENYDDYRDFVLGLVFSDVILVSMSNPEKNSLLSAVLKETWGDPGEEKNSSESGQSDQTNDEKKPAEVA